VRDLPGILLVLTLWLYWGRVAAMSHRVRRRTRALAGIVPEQGLEKVMWLAWVPIVIAWLALPILALGRSAGPLALPAFALEPPYAVARWLAALGALGCLLATVRVWRAMGAHWSMAVTAERNRELLTEGPFSRVRHPIYSLSLLLMLCSLIVVPTLPMLAIAVVHALLMVIKARNEERFLLGLHGEAYARYCARTGRFLPRLDSHQHPA
jgi:protein-S-isoprenylcysteine O-methyltransferase Ste14